MKSLLAALMLAGAIVAPSQDPQQGMMPPPPKELKSLWWMMGEWDTDLIMFEPGSAVGTPSKGAISSAEALGGMWIESRFESDMGGMPMKGLQMISYDPAKKVFIAYWFDNMGPGGLELTGKLRGQILTLTSKPIELPGMPGKHAFRATTALKGSGKLLMRIEMNSGRGWSKMLEGTMTRK